MIELISFFIIIILAKYSNDKIIRLQFAVIIIYFIMPNFFVRNFNILFVIDPLNIGYLSFWDNVIFNIIILFYCFTASISYKFFKRGVFKSNYKLQKPKNLPLILIFLFSIISVFYVSKITAIFNEGYNSYHLGSLSIQKSIFIVVVEQLFLILVILRINSKINLVSILFISYNFLTILTGLRLQGSLAIILWFIIFKFSKFNFKNILGLLSLSVIGSFFLVIVQRFRSQFEINRDLIESLFSVFFIDLLTQFNLTADTLRAVITKNIDFSINIFFNFFYFFKVLSSKILGLKLEISDKVDLGSFAHNLVNKYNPSLLSTGNTLGNSMFSEVYALGGLFGIFLLGIFYGFLFKMLKFVRISSKSNQLIFMYHFIFALPMIKAPRGSSIDWLLQALIFLFLALTLNKLRFNPIR